MKTLITICDYFLSNFMTTPQSCSFTTTECTASRTLHHFQPNNFIATRLNKVERLKLSTI